MADDSEEAARQRTYDRFERQVGTIHEFEAVVEDMEFPVTSAELSAEYRRDDEGGVEGGSLGSVLRHLDDEYEDERAARQAVLTELDEIEDETTGVVDGGSDSGAD